MADNTTLNSGSGGDTLRTEDRTTYKTPVSLIDVGGTSAELLLGDSGGFMPVANTVKDGTGTFYAPLVDADGHFQVDVLSSASHAVTNAGTFAVQAAQSGTWTVGLSAGAKVILTDGTDDLLVDTGHEDAESNDKTHINVGAMGAVFNGTTWDRMRGDITNGVLVNLGSNNDVTVTGTVTANAGTGSFTVAQGTASNLNATVIGTGTFAVQAAQSGTWTVDLGATDNAVLDAIAASLAGTLTVGSHAVTNAGTFAVQVDGSALTSLQLIDDCIFTDDAAYTPGTSKLAVIGAQADETSTDSVDEGDAGALRMTLDRKLLVAPQAHTAGGCSIFRSIDIDESEEEVKSTAGQVYGIYAINTTNATLYLKLYNATAANVTVGSTTPVMTLPVPGDNDTDGAGFYMAFPVGVVFDTAITVACTTAVADADTGAPGANACIVQVFYK